MGYFQLSDAAGKTQDGVPRVLPNPNSWNHVSNMLYFEHPAGVGFSYCVQADGDAEACSWDDKSQGEAYAKTLSAFFDEYPEFKSNDLYLTGESYAGQYIPNVAYYIESKMPDAFNLKGFAIGNGCWGTDNQCLGPDEDRQDVEFYYGHALISKKLYDQIGDSCDFSGSKRSRTCRNLLDQAEDQVGPHDVYNIYDNCPDDDVRGARNVSRRELRRALRESLAPGQRRRAGALGGAPGGYNWACGGENIADTWFQLKQVRAALHLGTQDRSRFSYNGYSNPSIDLYPELVKKYRILIYSGDADNCVPYVGSEEWTSGLAEQGVLREAQAWHPWYVNKSAGSIPAGYATVYDSPASPGGFTFLTVRLAGHMVPQYRPEAALDFITRFLRNETF